MPPPQPQVVYVVQQPESSGGGGKAVIIAIVVVVVVVAVIVGAMFLFVLMAPMSYSPPPNYAKNIGVACVKISGTGNYRCETVNADAGVDFYLVGAQAIKTDGTVVGTWDSPVDLGGAGANESVSSASPPMSATSKVVDNGDRSFGVGDTFFLNAVSGQSLVGLTLKLSGGGASGQATLA